MSKNLVLTTLLIFLVFILVFLTITHLSKKRYTSLNRLSTKILESTTPIPTITPNPITLIFTGDVIPARAVNSKMVRLNNFLYPFEKTAEFLKQADLTIINLESPLIENCPVTNVGMVFCGDPRFVDGLVSAGVDIANLANNHSTNYGKAGVDSTKAILSKEGILTVGTNDMVYTEVKGVKLAFLAYNGVFPFDNNISNIDREKIIQELREAKKDADYIIVLYHWGKEYEKNPVADPPIAPFDPIEIGRFTIDKGADLVVGNHPHVVQGYEIYKGKPIFYALGNFIFDQMWSEETKIGALLKIEIQDYEISNFSFHHVKIEDYAQPYFLE